MTTNGRFNINTRSSLPWNKPPIDSKRTRSKEAESRAPIPRVSRSFTESFVVPATSCARFRPCTQSFVRCETITTHGEIYMHSLFVVVVEYNQRTRDTPSLQCLSQALQRIARELVAGPLIDLA